MDEQKGSQTADTLLSVWIKSAADFWGSMLQNWTKQDAASDDSARHPRSSVFNEKHVRRRRVYYRVLRGLAEEILRVPYEVLV